MISFLLTAIIMYAFWIVLSGKFITLLLFLGVVSSFLVAYIFHRTLMGHIGWQRAIWGIKRTLRFTAYLPWLLKEIMKANIQVAYLILHPQMPINPSVIRFKTKLRDDLAIATFANSITLTPGTITVDCKDGEYCVHALDRASAEGLLTGKMESRVAEIFMKEGL